LHLAYGIFGLTAESGSSFTDYCRAFFIDLTLADGGDDFTTQPHVRREHTAEADKILSANGQFLVLPDERVIDHATGTALQSYSPKEDI
jgi:hypothetical protein